MEVKDLIAQWRRLNADLKVANEELDNRRKEFNEQDTAHAAAIAQYDSQKSAMQAAIKESLIAVVAAENTAKEKMTEAENMMAQARDRGQRNQKQMQVIITQQQALQAQVAARDEADRGIRGELEAFRLSRAQAQTHLREALQRASEQLAREAQEAVERKQSLFAQTQAAQAQLEREIADWTVEVSNRRRQVMHAFRERLHREINATNEGKKAWCQLRSGAPAPVPIDVTREIASLRAVLASRA